MAAADVFTFCQSDLQSKSFAAFEEMRKKGQLCDLTIKVQNQSIKAHRIIVAAGIPYFQSAFYFTGSKREEKQVTLQHNLDPRALESLILFAYTSKVVITTENVQSLLVTALFLELDQVRDSCIEFISRRLTIPKVMQVRELAINLKNSCLVTNCNGYIRKNFENFSKTPDFLRLSYSYVKELVSDNDLIVSSEEVVFKAIMKWVKFSPSDREITLPELLPEVRMIYLPIKYLMEVVHKEELIMNSNSCRDFVHKIIYALLLPEMTGFFYFKTYPRNSSMKRMYAICAEDIYGGHTKLSVCAFINSKWLPLFSRVHLPDMLDAVVAVDGKIYLFLSQSILIFNLRYNEWQELELLCRSVSGAAVVLHEKTIYCFGSLETEYASSTRIFCTQSNLWRKTKELKIRRRNAAAVSVNYSIYVTGGREEFFNINSVEKYSPSKNRWMNVSPMLVSRDSHGCISINEKIYVCGGFDSHCNTLNTAEMYDLLTDQWKFISSMRSSKSFHSLVPHCGKIYAFGKKDVEVYEPLFNEWDPYSISPVGLFGAVSVSASNIQDD